MNKGVENMKDSLDKSSSISLGWKEFSILFKSRVVGLLLLASIGGAFLAENGVPDWKLILILVVVGCLSASGSGALNEYLEKDSDALMTRTKLRPLVVASFEHPIWVPYVSILMILVPSLVVMFFNIELAVFLLSGAFIYVIVYTLWLKPRTILNIVIGGASGSAAVLSGSAVVGIWNDPGAIVLAALLFSWTPMHFWSLAVVCRDDYFSSNTPMLPVYLSIRQSSWWIMIHTLVTVFAALCLSILPGLGVFYFYPILVVSIAVLYQNIRLIMYPTVNEARRLFHGSNIYLALVILLICLNIAF